MKTKITLLLAAIIVSSCANPKLISRKITDQSKVPDDIVYHLPKTLLKLDIIVNSTEKKAIVNGVAQTDTAVYRIKSIQVTPVLVNDPSESFMLKRADGEFFFGENSSMKFNQFGIMQSLSSELSDKRPEMVENVLKSVASVAKVFITPGVPFIGKDEADKEKNSDIKEIKTKIDAAQSKLIKAIDNRDAKEIKAVKEQLVEYYSILKSHYENNKIETTTKELTYSYTVEVTSNDFEVPLSTLTGIAEMSSLHIKLEGDDLSFEKSKDTTTIYNGLVYRRPATLDLQITTSDDKNERSLIKTPVTFAQFGKKAVLPATAKLFAKKKTTIEFDPATGSLSQYAIESGSSSDAVGKTMATAAEDMRTTVNDIKYNIAIENLKKEKELKDLKEALETKEISEKEVLTGELEILRLQAEIDKLKKELAEAKR